MSEEVKTEEEPSIEEILDSIRQIISEDEEMEEEDPAANPVEEDSAEETPPPEPAPVEEEPAAEPEAEAEPLDQSAIDDMDFDSPTPEPEPEAEAEPSPEPESVEEEEDVLELTELVNSEENEMDVDMVEGDEISEPEPEPIVEPIPEPEPVVASETDGGSLLTAAAEAAAMSAVSELVRKTAIVNNSLTLEDIVRAELQPLLRDWLDKHLPTVIERLVKEELERVSKRVLDD